MKLSLLLLALFLGQINTLQTREVVHLPSHQDRIGIQFGGKLVELINSPRVVFLPLFPPKPDSEGVPWTVDIKNLGPGSVNVSGKSPFSVEISVGQTVRVDSNGGVYIAKH
jgi:hypothetical protein